MYAFTFIINCKQNFFGFIILVIRYLHFSYFIIFFFCFSFIAVYSYDSRINGSRPNFHPSPPAFSSFLRHPLCLVSPPTAPKKWVTVPPPPPDAYAFGRKKSLFNKNSCSSFPKSCFKFLQFPKTK